MTDEAGRPGATTPPRGGPLIPAVSGLLVLDLVGGVLAIREGVNRAADAWGSRAVLAAPLPMMLAQAALAVAGRGGGRRRMIASGLLAAACLISGMSGFFDGQLGRKGLPATLTAGGLAAADAIRSARTGGAGERR